MNMSELISLAAEINREHHQAEQMARTAIEHALKAGELLIKAKAQCAHGKWLPWLNNLDIGTRQAQKYMRLVRHRDSLPNTNSGRICPLNEALAAIAAPSEPEDKQPHEMLLQAVTFVEKLTADTSPANTIALVDSVLDEMNAPEHIRIKIWADESMERGGVISRVFLKWVGMLTKARQCASYHAGLEIHDVAHKLSITTNEAIAGICRHSGCTPKQMRECLTDYELADTVPVLPNPVDLRDCVRQQVAIEMAAEGIQA